MLIVIVSKACGNPLSRQQIQTHKHTNLMCKFAKPSISSWKLENKHPLYKSANHRISSMSRYAFIVKARATRDGCWVRLGGYDQTEEGGREFYCWLLPHDHCGDFVTMYCGANHRILRCSLILIHAMDTH